MKTSNRIGGLLLLTASLAAAAGCGGEFPLAGVSGVVTLDGEPLANASVYFQPQRRGGDPVVGPPSIGVTDEAGRYDLSTIEGARGAIVGGHVVSVSTFDARMVDPNNSDRVSVVTEERVPPRYRTPSELRFEVRSGGSDEADFQLTTQ